jgi:hypothetical protein
MPTYYTRQGCKVETTYVIQPNGDYREEITLSTDPAGALALAIEERAGKAIGTRAPFPAMRARR